MPVDVLAALTAHTEASGKGGVVEATRSPCMSYDFDEVGTQSKTIPHGVDRSVGTQANNLKGLVTHQLMTFSRCLTGFFAAME